MASLYSCEYDDEVDPFNRLKIMAILNNSHFSDFPDSDQIF